MPHRFSNNRLWAAPSNFSFDRGERKISWLELFYDLVYVIAISKITSYFSAHLDFQSFLDYTYIFIVLFWGWANGSWNHDFIGNSGLRSRFIIFWQMILVGILVICLNGEPEVVMFRATIALAALQLYITYMWWSINFYESSRKRANLPYTICYLIALVLLLATFLIENRIERPPSVRILFFLSLLFNFLPPFFSHKAINEFAPEGDYKLSSSMIERLGLLTTIVFGEVVLGTINAVTTLHEIHFSTWINFAPAMLVVFALWWIFFDLIAGRQVKSGFLMANYVMYSYIPTLMALGLTAVGFQEIFHAFENPEADKIHIVQTTFGLRISLFLLGILLISLLLKIDDSIKKDARKMRLVLAVAAIAAGAFSYFWTGLNLTIYLSVIFVILLVVILFDIRNWIVFGEIQTEKIEGLTETQER